MLLTGTDFKEMLNNFNYKTRKDVALIVPAWWAGSINLFNLLYTTAQFLAMSFSSVHSYSFAPSLPKSNCVFLLLFEFSLVRLRIVPF